MILGHGIDIQDTGRLAAAIAKQPRLVGKILTPAELAVYEGLPDRRAMTFLAGRWAAKEAFAKAYGTGIVAGCGFQDLEFLSNDKGAPICTRSPFEGRVWVSISHTADLAQASVILEGEGHDS